jgi:tRNA1Val (adenine37-N6)-methyltransferase
MLLENERFDLIQKNGYGIIQNKKWFSYGIDAVLISSFVEMKPGAKILDLGTGTGIIPLLLNLNNRENKIVGIEKQKDVFEMAKRSLAYNKIDSIDLIHCDVNDLTDHIPKASMDIVVTNPPYFKKGHAITNDEDIKGISRHETSADLEAFIKNASQVLVEKGVFYMVHRPMRLVDIMYYTRKYGLEAKSIQFVYPNQKKPPNILLIKCIKSGLKELKYEENLYVYDDNGNYTQDIYNRYKKLKIDVFY